MIEEEHTLYNRLLWVNPDGQYTTYNKRHLFRFGHEHEHYEPGSEKLIVELKGWKICPLVCYDLRFPVWARNTYKDQQFEYDCLIYVANWPERRAHHWKSLLTARAIENLSYCIGVNRIGVDGKNHTYSGNSMVVDPLGQVFHPLEDHQEGLIETRLDAQILTDWRNRFNVGLDWDAFEIL
jgi:predicted amidohydrolase